MAALAVAYVVVGFVADEAPPGMQATLAAVELALTAVFVMEFASRFLATYDRVRYLRGHWVDVIALVPTARGVRLLRLLRLLRLVRTFAGVYRALQSFERLVTHRRLIGLFMTWLAVAVVSSIALYLAEHDVNEHLRDPWDALWWGVVTLTTVGYGDVYPVTPEGRLAGATLMILGITLFATITGTITSSLIAEQEQDSPDAARALRALAALHHDGIIDDAEFASKKADLLERL